MPLVTSALRSSFVEELKKMPHGRIVQVHQGNKVLLYVLEQEPMEVRSVWKSKHPWEAPKGSEKHPVFVGFKFKVPWQYFLTRFTAAGLITDAFVFISPERIKDPQKSKLYMPPLPNIYPSGHICTGNIRFSVGMTPEERAQELLYAFWRTPFTSETWPKDANLVPTQLKKYGAVSRAPWTILPAWEKADAEKEKIRWRCFRFKNRRKRFPMDTLAKASVFALEFPRRTDIYE